MKMTLPFPCLSIHFINIPEWLLFISCALVQIFLCHCRHWNSGFFSFELELHSCFGTKMFLCFIKIKCMFNKCRKVYLYNHTPHICINDRYLNLGRKGTPLCIVHLLFKILHRRLFVVFKGENRLFCLIP